MKKELQKTITIGDKFKFSKRSGLELTGVFIKEKTYGEINYYFLKDETGKIHQINPKNATKL